MGGAVVNALFLLLDRTFTTQFQCEIFEVRTAPPLGGLAPDPPMVASGIRSPIGLVVLSLVPDTLEFWVRFPNERNQGKQAHPVLKYRVPHGSHLVVGS